MELWDAYDAELNKIDNLTLVRGEKIPDGLYHLVSEIIVRHIDGTYLLMQRDINKHYGGWWEATAGGSALSGETPLECAKRELKEETGINASKLVEIGRVVIKQHNSIYVEYLCVTDWKKEEITLQEGETIDFMWVRRDKLVSIKDDELATVRIQKFVDELK